ncbi:hypothetical protein [Sphaerimonospora thailandensis]|uniref:Uncharacterized protein n=1 Tax=Sphaerimonospora thailandensis TaxID=795644 RepID=A0A8J3R9M5_9ACTN|nr:hypothetical protein [Sphaerimonospora thailandensis]GIH70311.1 hypothetical protein Mth01_25640 [Sphaerimonospora thailandensis]
MVEIPAEATQAAAKALWRDFEDYEECSHSFSEMPRLARLAVEAAATHIAGDGLVIVRAEDINAVLGPAPGVDAYVAAGRRLLDAAESVAEQPCGTRAEDHSDLSAYDSPTAVLRQRATDAALTVWNRVAIMCEHTQRIPVGDVVDVVLAVRDDELRKACLHAVLAEVALKGARQKLADASAALARVRSLADRWGVTDPGGRDEILAAVDGPAAGENPGGVDG